MIRKISGVDFLLGRTRSTDRGPALCFIVVAFFILAGVTLGAIQKIGMVGDVHVGDRADSSFNHYTESLVRMAVAMTAFNVASVDLLVENGDWVDQVTDYDAVWDDLIDLQVIWNDNTTYSNLTGVVRLYTIGNHDFSPGTEEKTDFIIALGNNANDELTGQSFPTATEQTYGYYDLGNLRIFILDTSFDVNGDDDAGVTSYISERQLIWLENQLTIADAVGKWSVIFMHKSILTKEVSSEGVINGSLVNAQDLLDIVDGHQVAFAVYSHFHSLSHSFVDPSCLDNAGNRILWKHLHPLITSSPTGGAADASYAIAYVNDATGEWFFSGNDGGGDDDAFEKGTRQLKWTGNTNSNPVSAGNYDYRKADLTFDTNDTIDADLLINFSKAYVDAEGTPRTNIIDGLLGIWDGGVTEMVVESDWLIPLGADAISNQFGLAFEKLGYLEMNSGFAGNTRDSNDYTWINSRSGFGKVIVNGANGNGGKFMHISNDNTLAFTNKSWHDVEITTGDNTYTVIFQDESDEMDMKSLVLNSGIADLIDVRGIDGGDSLILATVNGGILQLSRDAADISVDATTINVLGSGSLDVTTGSNAANGLTIGILNIFGGTLIDLGTTNIAVTNDVHVFGPISVSGEFPNPSQYRIIYHGRGTRARYTPMPGFPYVPSRFRR